MYTATATAAATFKKAAALDTNALLEKHSPLVKRIAHHMLSRLPSSVQLSDLVQAGLIGLLDAINRYEESQGVAFEAYASQRIRGAMLDDLRANDWFPRSARKTQRTLDGALARTEQKLGRPATEAEVANELGVDLEEYQTMLAEANSFQLVFFEDMGHDDEGADYLDRNLADESADPFRILGDARFKKDLVKAIENLPEREKLLMGLYYQEELNFKEIAAVLGVTESRVCQLHSQAVSRLRGKLKSWTK